MKKKIQGYRVFLSLPFQIALFFLIPIFCCLLTLLPLLSPIYLVTLCLSLGLLVSLEIFLDFWIFGGIASKQGGQPEYLKSSQRGLDFMNNALRTHQMRQLFAFLFVFLVERLLYCILTKTSYFSLLELRSGITFALTGYFFTELGILISRFFSSLGIQIVIVSIATILFSFASLLGVLVPTTSLIISLLLSILITFVLRNIMTKKIKEGYYDQTN